MRKKLQSSAIPHAPRNSASLQYELSCRLPFRRLCDGFVAFLIRRDPAAHLRFCALQSPQALPYLEAAGITAEDATKSFVYVKSDGTVLRRSDAALAVAAELQFPWPMIASCGWLIPRVIRDAIYDFVSHNRHLLGRLEAGESCLAPTANVLKRMLDADEIRASLKRDAAAARQARMHAAKRD